MKKTTVSIDYMNNRYMRISLRKHIHTKSFALCMCLSLFYNFNNKKKVYNIALDVIFLLLYLIIVFQIN